MLRTLTVKPCNRIIKPAETSISLYRSLCFPAANKNLLHLKRRITLVLILFSVNIHFFITLYILDSFSNSGIPSALDEIALL